MAAIFNSDVHFVRQSISDTNIVHFEILRLNFYMLNINAKYCFTSYSLKCVDQILLCLIYHHIVFMC